jgi:aminocarboxymuconate-semialdehyde decarboxylase
LDVHAHLAPIVPERLDALAGVAWDAATGTLSVDGHVVGMKPLFKPEALIAWMDENAVSTAWISIPPPLYRQALTETDAAAWCAYANDGLLDIALRHPGRLTALPHLPVEHPALAARIAAENIAAGRIRFAMATGVPGATLSDPSYAPLWTVLDDAAAFLFLHPGEGCDGRMESFYLQNLLGNPVETGLAAAHLVLSGILERHQRLTVCLAHGGGVAPAVAARLERGHATARPGLDASVEAPKEGFRRFCADCIVHSRAAFDLAESVFGGDKMLFGSDWPFPMGLPRPHAQLADLAPEQRRRLFTDNPARLLGTNAGVPARD